MINYAAILERGFWGNSILDWLIAAAAFMVALFVIRLVKRIIVSRLRSFSTRTATDVDKFIAVLIDDTNILFIGALGIYAAALTLPEKGRALSGAGTILTLTFVLQAAIWGSRFVTFGLTSYMRSRHGADPAGLSALGLLTFLGRMLVWLLAALLLLDNLGIDITALVAGLGVGGIAVALALQNILGDLFASLSIVLDRPFVVGDFIIVDQLLGTVEHIGIKTTRIRSLSGEQVIVSNSDLLKARIRNYKRMQERRVVFSIGVTYQTSFEKVSKIAEMIREIISEQENVRFDRAHFASFGDFSLVFEAVYYVIGSEYVQYMNTQQKINLAIMERFAAEGIEFAYPTQTLFINKQQS